MSKSSAHARGCLHIFDVQRLDDHLGQDVANLAPRPFTVNVQFGAEIKFMRHNQRGANRLPRLLRLAEAFPNKAMTTTKKVDEDIRVER